MVSNSFFVSHKIGPHLTHPVKNPPSCHVEDLGGGVLAVLLGKQGHLQLRWKEIKEEVRVERSYLESRRVGQVLGLLLHVLVLHTLHI